MDLRVCLAISLHAPDDATRKALVPGSPGGRVDALIAAATRYGLTTGRDATAEYVLIRGENDGPQHAAALARALRGQRVHVNLIPLNPVAHRPDLKPPSGRDAVDFRDVLLEAGVSCTLRTQRGEDIDAACGQLALERALGENEG